MEAIRKLSALVLFTGAALVLTCWALDVQAIVELMTMPIYAHGLHAGPLTVSTGLASIGFLLYP